MSGGSLTGTVCLVRELSHPLPDDQVPSGENARTAEVENIRVRAT